MNTHEDFIVELYKRINDRNCEDHGEAMTDSGLIQGARELIEDRGACIYYSNIIVNIIIDIFSNRAPPTIYQIPRKPFGSVEITRNYTIRDTLPIKECFRFINLMMKIYKIYIQTYSHSHDELPDIVLKEADEWLILNGPGTYVKSAAKLS